MEPLLTHTHYNFTEIQLELTMSVFDMNEFCKCMSVSFKNRSSILCLVAISYLWSGNGLRDFWYEYLAAWMFSVDRFHGYPRSCL